MRKSVLTAFISLALTACLGFSLAACTGDKGNPQHGSGHIANADDLHGELLDDGGEIHTSEGIYTFSGLTFTGEHTIIIGQDTDRYVLNGLKEGTWTNNSATFGRVQSTSPAANVTFTLDFSGAKDKTRVGCKLNLIYCRGSVLISVSNDNEHWVDIGYNTKTGIYGDYVEHITELRGTTVSDKNLYSVYYALGGYLGESDTLYLRCGFSRDYFQGSDQANNAIGADVIDHISYYDDLTFQYEAI